MRGALAVVAVVIVAVAVGLGVSTAVHHRPGPGGAGGGPTTSGPLGGGAAGTGTTVPSVEIVPGPGQTFLTGTIASLTADNALGPALTPPFTITIPVRGAGSADMTGVSVGGQAVEIYWYGGQPLPVSGTGQLALDGAALTVDASGITWMLDGAARSLTTGHFFLGAPVAVGTAGLAQPDQSVSFDAGDRSTIETTGHAQVHLPPAGLHVTGPGRLTLQGDLETQTATTTTHVHSVTFGPGSYDVSLTPVASGDTIKATLQGPVSSN